MQIFLGMIALSKGSRALSLTPLLTPNLEVGLRVWCMVLCYHFLSLCLNFSLRKIGGWSKDPCLIYQSFISWSVVYNCFFWKLVRQGCTNVTTFCIEFEKRACMLPVSLVSCTTCKLKINVVSKYLSRLSLFAGGMKFATQISPLVNWQY